MVAKNNAFIGGSCGKARKRRYYFAVVLSLAGASILVALKLSPGAVEPEFEGRPLSSWLEMKGGIEPLPDEAKEAVRHMGTNALPFLVKLLNHEDSRMRAFLYRTLPGAGEFGGTLRSYLKLTPDYVIQERGAEGIRALGAAASPVLPVLLRRLTNSPGSDVGAMSARAMAAILPEGPQLLVSALINQCPDVRRAAAMGLGSVEAETESALAALRFALGDSDPGVREAAEESIQWLSSPRDSIMLIE